MTHTLGTERLTKGARKNATSNQNKQSSGFLSPGMKPIHTYLFYLSASTSTRIISSLTKQSRSLLFQAVGIVFDIPSISKT